ncbi:MAG: DNA gyrase subunit A [Betaproteobacteria bacterium AqS2]|uniref:DNA gyrase subunit A n=1 Tax=Candidatus Amphirhobacter heronislandensis TaxID=1732024 RepID=A0A930Y2H3_9GAMM|nr:DNA gyrase subunit A [Betaproteobacteria bacterium AqS2]
MADDDNSLISQDEKEFAREVSQRTIEDKMSSSYLDYAMSVIVSRALPDVRDGMKPVHRRILYAMKLAGNDYNKPYKKSARIVGDVLGKFHPHSQEAVYESIVRMAQEFTMRYLLVDGQGNFGSVDGDEAAAMRYTEIRLARLAHEVMHDIDKEAVDMMPNYDGSTQEPTVLAPNFPALLVNGSTGIAVGMATNIPPHNLAETISACLLLLQKPEATIADLMRKIKAPDFPTAGFIHGLAGVREAYRTGNGRVVMRGRADIETAAKTKRETIIVTELPYTVNKAKLLEYIADLVREKKLAGISDLRDESDRSGMRVVIEIKRDAQAAVVLNNLYKMTELQKNFPVNMVALVHGVPKVLDLKKMLEHFLAHRKEVVYRRCLYDLERAREKAHGLEGLAVAVSNVEEVIEIIKKAPSPQEAKQRLMARDWKCKTVVGMLAKLKRPELARPAREPGNWGLRGKGSASVYRLSERQAQAILDMRLARLTAIERDKIVIDYEETVAAILDLLDILSKPERIVAIVKDELETIKKNFGDKRRSEIDESGEEIDNEDLIERTDMVVTLSGAGYIKAHKSDEYRTQTRGGTGLTAAGTKDGDVITDLHHANSHDMVLFFTSRGRLYWKKIYQLPSYTSRNSWGKPVVNILPLVEGEQIEEMLTAGDLERDDLWVFMATRNGIVKQTPLKAFANPRTAGIIAISIDDGDRLIGAKLARKDSQAMLFTDGGKAVRFETSKVRSLGRTARGVKGIRLLEGQQVVSLAVSDSPGKQHILTVTATGKGKRTEVEAYTLRNRGGQGLNNISKAAGKVVKCILVEDDSDVMTITDTGRMIRVKTETIRKSSRATQGVKLIRLKGDENIADVVRLPQENGGGDLLPPAEGS